MCCFMMKKTIFLNIKTGNAKKKKIILSFKCFFFSNFILYGYRPFNSEFHMILLTLPLR